MADAQPVHLEALVGQGVGVLVGDPVPDRWRVVVEVDEEEPLPVLDGDGPQRELVAVELVLPDAGYGQVMAAPNPLPDASQSCEPRCRQTL